MTDDERDAILTEAADVLARTQHLVTETPAEPPRRDRVEQWRRDADARDAERRKTKREQHRREQQVLQAQEAFDIEARIQQAIGAEHEYLIEIIGRFVAEIRSQLRKEFEHGQERQLSLVRQELANLRDELAKFNANSAAPGQPPLRVVN